MKKTSLEGITAKILVLTILLLTLFLPVASASDLISWDNYKEFVKDETTSIYGKIIIKDWNLITPDKTLIEYELLENTDYCSINCSATGKAKLNERGKLFIGIEFENLGLGTKVNKENRFYLLEKKTREAEVNDYNETCKEKTALNGTKYQECTQDIIGSHTETIEYYEKISQYNFEDVEAGEYYWKLEGTKGKYETIDWIAESIGGFKLTEWAVWTAGLNNGLVAYYKTDEGTGTTTADSLGLYNVSNIIDSWTTGKISGAYKSTGTASKTANTTIDTNGWTELCYNYWANSTTDVTAYHMGIGNAGSGAEVRFNLYQDSDNFGCNAYGMSGACELGVNGVFIQNRWQMITICMQSGNQTLWVNGTAVDSGTRTFTSFGGGIRGGITLAGSGADEITANGLNLDEIGIWDRILTNAEVTELWNNGEGITYDDVNSITVNLLNPENYRNTSLSGNYFGCNATPNGAVSINNLTLIIWNNSGSLIYNITNNTLGTNNLLNVSYNLPYDGRFNWTCLGRGNSSSEYFSDYANANWTLLVDSAVPVINITYPLNGSVINTLTEYTLVGLNSTIIDANPSTCWYYNGTANTTITCGNNATINSTAGSHTWIVYVNDTAGNFNSKSVTFTLIRITLTPQYQDPAVEDFNYNITLNVSATLINTLNATFYYNNTLYYPIVTFNSTFGQLRTLITTPKVSANTLVPFNWTVTINSENFTTNYSHTVYFITPITFENNTCSAGLSEAICFTFADEQNLSALSMDSVNYNFQFGVSNSTYKTVNGTLTNNLKTCLCINSTVYNNYQLGYGEVWYKKSGWADRRFYTFSSQRLSNSTVNLILYSLINSEATSFLFDFKTTSYSAYINKYASLLRWYPEANTYKTVEMGRTDDKGQTIMRVEVEDADYRVGLYEFDGTLIKLLNPVRFACLTSPCEYSVQVEDEDLDYSSYLKVQVSLTQNITSGVVTFIWNDPTQNTDNMTLLVYKVTPTTSITICNSTSSGYTGVITCDTSAYTTGDFKAIAYRQASPLTAIASLVWSKVSNAFQNGVGLFITAFMYLTVVLVGIFSPVVGVILGIASLLPAYYLGSITFMVLIGITVIGVVIIHFMRRTGS